MNRDEKRKQVREAVFRCRNRGLDLDIAVGLIMTANPPSARLETPLHSLVSHFQTTTNPHLFVVDAEGELVGLLTPRDLLAQPTHRARSTEHCTDDEARRESGAQMTASDLVSEELVSVEPSTSVRRALRLMIALELPCLPVCSRDVPIGILTSADLHLFTEELLSGMPTAQAL